MVGRTCFHGKPPGAKVEEVLEGGSEEVHDEYIVILLLAEPADVGDADAPLKDLVQLGLVKQLGMAGFVGLELDGHFLSICDVDACRK